MPRPEPEPGDPDGQPQRQRQQVRFLPQPTEPSTIADHAPASDAMCADGVATGPVVVAVDDSPPTEPALRFAFAAHRAAMMVVGSHGTEPLAGLLTGSTSQALLHRADCPVIVVRTPEHDPDSMIPSSRSMSKQQT